MELYEQLLVGEKTAAKEIFAGLVAHVIEAAGIVEIMETLEAGPKKDFFARQQEEPGGAHLRCGKTQQDSPAERRLVSVGYRPQKLERNPDPTRIVVGSVLDFCRKAGGAALKKGFKLFWKPRSRTFRSPDTEEEKQQKSRCKNDG